MKNYILSIYTHLFQRNKLYYLYNAETGMFSSVEENVYRLLYDGAFEQLEKPILKELLKRKIIIKENEKYDYYHAQKLAYLSNIAPVDSLDLVLVPTTGCNFDCPYCFEGEKRCKTMSKHIINRLICFINSFQSVKKLNLLWYGGEPLIAFDRIKYIVQKIKEQCNANIKSQSIVTNGYCISDDVIKFFKSDNFESIQISFDGIAERHNKTRYLKKNHGETFSIILSNLDKLVYELPETCTISLRININKDNEDDFANMYHFFSKRYPHKNVVIYPGFIEIPSDDSKHLCYNCINNTEKYHFFKKMADLGVNVNFFPEREVKGCGVHTNSNYIIGPSGELYKCWNDFNHPKKIIGNIKTHKITNISLLTQYLFDSSVFDDKKCKDCFVFPICDGGCAWKRQMNLFNKREYELCTFLKSPSVLEKCLLEESSDLKNKENEIRAQC